VIKKVNMFYEVYDIFASDFVAISSQVGVTNFIWSYLHQIFDDFHGPKTSLKPLRRPFDQCQSRFETINNG